MADKKKFTPAELAAFNMGYKAAMGILKDTLLLWSKAEETHSACRCSHCTALREIAVMKYLYIYPERGPTSGSK